MEAQYSKELPCVRADETRWPWSLRPPMPILSPSFCRLQPAPLPPSLCSLCSAGHDSCASPLCVCVCVRVRACMTMPYYCECGHRFMCTYMQNLLLRGRYEEINMENFLNMSFPFFFFFRVLAACYLCFPVRVPVCVRVCVFTHECPSLTDGPLNLCVLFV